MSKYMTYERLEQIAKVVGTECKERSGWYNRKDQIGGYSASEEYTDRDFLLSDGSLKTHTIRTGDTGWIKDKTTNEYIYYIDFEYDRYNWVAYKKSTVYITEAQIKKGLAILQARERKPIFVGTKQVSAIYVKQNGTIKTAKPYIKQSGQIKAL